MYSSRSDSMIQLVVQLGFLVLLLNWKNEVETASLSGITTESLPVVPPPQTIGQDSLRLRRSSDTLANGSTSTTLCLPAHMDELIQKYKILRGENSVTLMPILHNGRFITVGISSMAVKFLSNHTLMSCIKTFSLHEDPNRFPRYMLFTECKSDCSSSLRLLNKPSQDGQENRYFKVAVLIKNSTCSKESGKESWTPQSVSIPQCTIISN